MTAVFGLITVECDYFKIYLCSHHLPSAAVHPRPTNSHLLSAMRTSSGRIVKPTLRYKRHIVNRKSAVPAPGSEIKVLWICNARMRWWSASVLESREVTRPPVVGIGVLLYTKYGNYSEESARVEFLRSNSHELLLRHYGSECTVFDSCSWFYDGDKYPLISSTKPSIPETSTGKHRESSDNDSADTGDSTVDPSIHITNLNSSPPLTQRESLVPMLLATSSTYANILGHALLEIRKELMLKIDTQWALPRHASTLAGEGYVNHGLEVTIGCSLRTAQCLAATTRNRIEGSKAVAVPDFPEVERCSLAIERIVILLFSLKEVCELLDIRDRRDYQRLLMQSRKIGRAGVLTVAGSAGRKEKSDKSTWTRAVIGSSFMQTVPNTNLALYDTHDIICEQHKVAWDDGMRCFMSPWVLSDRNESVGAPYDLSGEGNDIVSRSERCFKLFWTPGRMPVTRNWTSDALNTGGDTLGFLTLCVPVVAFYGQHTVNGVNNVLVESTSTN